MSDDQDVRRREEQVRGEGPRILPMQVEDFSEEALEMTRRMMRAASNEEGKPSLAGVPEIIPIINLLELLMIPVTRAKQRKDPGGATHLSEYLQSLVYSQTL